MLFQYIPCYGLSSKICNVHVRYTKFQYIPCYGLSSRTITNNRAINISIHPMLRFIKLFVAVKVWYPNFNTSHVTVYQTCAVIFAILLCYFNTSHVTVYLMILSHFYLGIFHHFLYFTSFQHFLPADYKI